MRTKETIQLTLCFFLQGCAYRYGAGYFIAGEQTPPEAPAAFATSPQPPAEPVPQPSPPCTDAGTKKTTLEVINKLDQQNQTMTTTAITETVVKPCQ
jgi:hypothetical protein